MKDQEHYEVISSTQNSPGDTSQKMMTEVAQELLIIFGNCKWYDANSTATYITVLYTSALINGYTNTN